MLSEGGRPSEQVVQIQLTSCFVRVLIENVAQLVVEHEYLATYAYYKVPSPWLQVKLLRLLQYYPPTGESNYIIFGPWDSHCLQRTLPFVGYYMKYLQQS